MIFAYIFPYNAHAKGMIFPIDPELSKPRIIYRPYANEFKRFPPKIKGEVQPKVRNKTENKRPQQSTRSNQESYGEGQIQDLIRKSAQQFGIEVSAPLCIAKKESGYNPNSRNKNSSAAGIYQYLSGTWKATDEGKLGLSVFTAEDNIRAAVKYMAIHKSTSPWISTAKNCPPLSFQ